MLETTQAKIDATIATGAISAPLWLQYIELWMRPFFLIGGGILLTLRIAIALREWRGKKKGD